MISRRRFFLVGSALTIGTGFPQFSQGVFDPPQTFSALLTEEHIRQFDGELLYALGYPISYGIAQGLQTIFGDVVDLGYEGFRIGDRVVLWDYTHSLTAIEEGQGREAIGRAVLPIQEVEEFVCYQWKIHGLDEQEIPQPVIPMNRLWALPDFGQMLAAYIQAVETRSI